MRSTSKHIPKYKVGDIINKYYPNINPFEENNCENCYVEVVSKTGYILVNLEDQDQDCKDYYSFIEFDLDTNICKIGEMTADWNQIIEQRVPKTNEILHQPTDDISIDQDKTSARTATQTETTGDFYTGKQQEFLEPVTSSDMPTKRRRGRPKGSKNKPKSQLA